MLARFGVLAGARAALAQQAEAGQERLAQGWARLRQYQEEASSELLRTNNELTQLHARLEAARHEVLQGVRGDVGCPRSPPRERGSSMDTKRAAEGRCPMRWWWEAGRHPLGWAGGPHVPRKHHQQLCMGGTQPGLPGPPVPAGGVQGTQGSGWGGAPRALCHSVPQESCWAHVQSTATQKTLLLGQIKLAVLNLFQLATARLKVPTDMALEDTEAQLDTVSAALSPGRWGRGDTGTFTSPDGCGIRLPSLQVLLCMQDLTAICAELRPRQMGPCPPRLPAATSMHPRRHGGARAPPSQE